MTIASAFNEITVAQGGAPSTSGTIAGAIDALNDALAGSDQDAAQTIEGAVKLLGQHIGGGGGTDIGDTPFPFRFTAYTPVVSREPSESQVCFLTEALVGGKTAVRADAITNGYTASGVVIKTNVSDFINCKAYKVVVDPDSEAYASVAEVEGIVEKVDTPNDNCYYLITVPELQGAWSEDGWYEGEELHICATNS